MLEINETIVKGNLDETVEIDKIVSVRKLH